MSLARQEFLRNIAGIREAIQLEPIAVGAGGAAISPGIIVLRRGVVVASLVALESFVRDRTKEIAASLQRWPRTFDELPERLRIAARIEALSHLQKFAKLLKRQGEDYEWELRTEISKMASGHGTVLDLTKFIAGDFTGNISSDKFSELLKAFQIANHWASFRTFAAETGFGIPSVEQILKNVVAMRHKSAHSAGFIPTATDVAELDTELLCIGMCFDIALTASVEVALTHPDDWSSGTFVWRDKVDLYLVSTGKRGLRIVKSGKLRATAVVTHLGEARARVPRPALGSISVLVVQDSAGRPSVWSLLHP